jgi:ACS family hexuronate transporter-like MFS transporter
MTDGMSPSPETADETPVGVVLNESEIIAPHPLKMGSIRWRICALLFFANTINYMDRQVLGVLAPLLQVKIGWNEVQYGYIVEAFQAAYALGLLAVGGIIDAVGVRLGYALAIGLWSLAAISHSLARSAFSFGVSRFFLGLGESGNFPAAVKTVAEWFPKKERAFATGIFNCGTNVGATLVPLVVPWIAVTIGWQWAFLFTGAFSLTWLLIWWSTYTSPEDSKNIGAAELAYIRSDPAEISKKVPWIRLLGYRQTWALLIGKGLTDPVWWFLLFWLPKYFTSEFGIKLEGLALPLVVIYNAAAVGSIGGGWMPAEGVKLGLSVKVARRLSMLLCAIAVMPVMLIGNVHSLWVAIGIISVAVAAHQGWSANIFTLASDIFPRSAVGSVTGVAGFGGAMGGILAAYIVSHVLQHYHTYSGLFVGAGLAYITALLIIQLLVPKQDLVRHS